MATYTLTIDLTGFEYPLIFAELLRQRCPIDLGFWGNLDIESIASQSAIEIQNLIPDSTCTYVIIDNTIIFTLISTTILTSPQCGNIVGIRIIDNQKTYNESWIEAELCPTCQDVTIDNCGSIIFQTAIPNGTYEVQIEDHQSGITYMQDIEFTASQGTWDQTNTAGVFTPFSVYTVTILDASGNPVSWVDGSIEYTCMRLTFATFTDTTPS